MKLNHYNDLNSLNDSLNTPTEIEITVDTDNVATIQFCRCYRVGRMVSLDILCYIKNTSTNFRIASNLPFPIETFYFSGINKTQSKALRLGITQKGELYLNYNQTGNNNNDEFDIHIVYIAKY